MSWSEDSILDSTKKMLGIDPDHTTGYNAFDMDIMISINSALNVLTQVGVGDPNGFQITGYEEEWSDFIPSTYTDRLGIIKNFVHLKVKQLFDPPLQTNVMSAMENQLQELLWRISVTVDPGD